MAFKDSKTTSFFSEEIELEGELSLKGGIRIDGILKGEIECEATVYCGDTAKIEADIIADSVISSGQIEGDIIAENMIKINNPGTLSGQVRTSSLGLEKGAFFNGRCHMLNPKDNKKPDLIPPIKPRKAIPNRD